MSGLYNALFGVHPAAGLLLKILDIDHRAVGRFRDCFPNPEGDRIIIYTRNGGGNRNDYLNVFAELAKHPCYVRDYDDDFDSTYASSEFRVPEDQTKIVKTITHVYDCTPPAEKWQKGLAELAAKTPGPLLDKATALAKEIGAAIQKGENAIIGDNEMEVRSVNANPK